MSDANKTLLRAFHDAGDRGDLIALAGLLAADAVDHDPLPGYDASAAGISQSFALLHSAFGDLTSHLPATLADGDRVATVQQLCGTHQGEFMGIPPTGRRVAATAIHWMRITDGRVSEHWGLLDMWSIRAQLAGPEPGMTRSIPLQRSGEGVTVYRPGSASPPRENKSYMRSAMELVNSGALRTFGALIHSDCIDHTPPAGPGLGRVGWQQRLAELTGAFTSASFSVQDQTAEGDLVSSRYEFTGRHTGGYAGLKPTGRPVCVTVMDMVRIRDGQIVEHWGLADMPSLIAQLGGPA
jgi:predicted ester cyclase